MANEKKVLMAIWPSIDAALDDAFDRGKEYLDPSDAFAKSALKERLLTELKMVSVANEVRGVILKGHTKVPTTPCVKLNPIRIASPTLDPPLLLKFPLLRALS